MPQEYDNRNRGVLFNNAEKKTEETHPDYAGTINTSVTCQGCGATVSQDFWLNAWLKTAAQSGKRFMSLSVKPKAPRA